MVGVDGKLISGRRGSRSLGFPVCRMVGVDGKLISGRPGSRSLGFPVCRVGGVDGKLISGRPGSGRGEAAASPLRVFLVRMMKMFSN